MWQLFIYLMIKALQIMLWVLLGSLRLAWGILKWEFRAVRVCFYKYPIGFFSFFIHFLGFWIGLFGAELGFGRIWIRIYTLGLCGGLEDYLEIIGIPLKLLSLTEKIDSHIGMSILMFGIMFFMISCFFLYLEMVFALFPVLQAIITQLILGIVFRKFVENWQYKRGQKILRKRAKFAVEEFQREQQYAGLDRRQHLQPISCGDGLMTVDFKSEESRQPIRDFNPSYKSVVERVSKQSLKLHQVYVQLVEKKGTRGRIKQLYEELLEQNNELQRIYMNAFNVVSFSEDEQEVKLMYEELKRETMRLKNVQADFIGEIKKSYDISL